jgi:hypothetical protein
MPPALVERPGVSKDDRIVIDVAGFAGEEQKTFIRLDSFA